MQLDELVLFNFDGRSRSIKFRSGELNVITGDSRKGKSSLINIIRYLLGSGSPHAPSGPIQKHVAWYGLRAHIGTTPFFIGRPAPARGSETNAAMLLRAQTIVPDFADLEVNCAAVDVRGYIGGLLGIEENLNIPRAGQTRAPLEATFVHSLYYCFQGQGEIANPDLLFHHQNRDYQTQTIRDTLPYFLGAQGVEELRMREQLSRASREFRSAVLRANGLVALKDTGLGQAGNLLSEARNVGLIDSNQVTLDLDTARSLLLTLSQAVSAVEPPTVDVGGEFTTLSNERHELIGRLRVLGENTRALDDFAGASDEYTHEVVEQEARLASIGLMPVQGHTSTCPLCSQMIALDSMAHDQILVALGDSTKRLEQVRRERPRVERAKAGILSEIDRARIRLVDINTSLETLATQQELVMEAPQAVGLQNYVRGRIAQYLESTPTASDEELESAQALVEHLRHEVEELEGQLDDDALKSRTTSLVQTVSRRVTEFAMRLGLEHAETGVRIDNHRLTIVADTPEGPAYMDRGEIGSGMNWVGYHLAAYLALQEFFIQRGRPVPGFLVLDQASQAFFPRDREAGGDLDELSDTDRKNTKKLYRLMYDAVSEMGGKLQIIALDHADFDDEWFKSSVIERWRGNNALIPYEWID